METRIEKDFLGEKELGAQDLWGVHTQRALENFAFSSLSVPATLISALALVKKACAQANAELGYIPPEVAEAIYAACAEIIAGGHLEAFPLDALQGGAGTSTNMNMNEVVANLANEKLGGRRGEYAPVSPLDTVNLHQSTNDVYPTALKVAAIFAFRALAESAAGLQGVFQHKEKDFAWVVKIGRTEMQEAVPMTLGAEFGAFAESIARDRWRAFKCEERLRTVNLGGTAVGTGLCSPRKYIFLAVEKLRALSGMGLSRAENMVEQTANADCFVEVSATLKSLASNLIKIGGDLRMLHMLGEIKLPPVQAGSSIMPGKINPVMAEAVIQAGLKVLANDLLVAEAASRGTLQICEFLPLLGYALLESLEILTNACQLLAEHVDGIKAAPQTCAANAAQSFSIITAFLPLIGYKRAEELVRELQESKRTDVQNFLNERLGKDTVSKILSAQNLSSLGYRENGQNA